MNIETLDAQLLKKAFLSGAAALSAHKDMINELNVFPVPDGDTGTNMTMTVTAAAKEVAALDTDDISAICKAISSGSLRGARGNSGVILSQLLRGFTKGLLKSETIDTNALSLACVKATETAYKAVMKPKEGTILTVAKAICESAAEVSEKTTDIIEFAELIIKAGDETLQKTPEMLPVLKEAGVVDSGGQGLIEFLKGALKGLKGEEISLDEFEGNAKATASSTGASYDAIKDVDIKFGYCTEFIINLQKEFPISEETAFKAFLESIGDSIVCVADDDFVKIHVHTNDPGKAITRALTYGSLSKIKIDNMREEHNERLFNMAANEEKVATPKSTEWKEYGIISVSAGSGLSEIFKGIGADIVVEGGQTMNPSTDDLLKAIKEVHAKSVYILPNNKNIILASEQAARLAKDSTVLVVPTKNIPQGIAALINFSSDATAEENLEHMSSEADNIISGQVTYAVRDTSIDGHEIHKDDIMGMADGGILSTGNDINLVTIEMISSMLTEDSELISLYYGADITEAAANGLLSKLSEIYPDIDIELNAGGQPVYYYIVSVE